jgi:hypothetical protein
VYPDLCDLGLHKVTITTKATKLIEEARSVTVEKKFTKGSIFVTFKLKVD